MITRPQVLRGQRVTLRPFCHGFSDRELADLYQWSQDPEVLLLSGGAPLDMPFTRFRDLFRAQLPRRNSDEEQLFAILDEADVLIGRAGLLSINRNAGRAELGVVIGAPERWGHGYGRDAVRTLVGFGFQQIGLTRIVLYTYTENERARRAFEAAGFSPLRELQRFSLELGTHTELEMEILATPTVSRIANRRVEQ